MKRWRIMPKFSFVNYRKEFPNSGTNCWKKWFDINRYWFGRLIYFQVKHYCIQLDFRKSWVQDMIDGGGG